MDNNKISKYKKTWIVIAFMSLAFFILTLVCFFKFSTLIDSQKEEPIYALTALGTLLFVFFIFGYHRSFDYIFNFVFSQSKANIKRRKKRSKAK